MHSVRINLQKFVKERPIVDDCLTHFFRAGFIALPTQRQRAGGAIVLNDHRMIHRQIVRTLIEIFEGIATRGHDLRDELIGFANGALRIVHEARLNAPPFAGERIGLLLRELVQIETTDTIGAFPENGVSASRADSLNGTFILGAKALA
jgi:hypothetical protein